MTHLCSDRVTHTKNTIWNRFARGQKTPRGDIIHAEGVRVAPPSSLRARKSLGCQDRDLLSMAKWIRTASGGIQLLLICPRARAVRAGGQKLLHPGVVLGHFWRAK